VGEPVRWDGSLEALRRIQREMPDCLLSHDPGTGILYVRTEANPEAPVPFGWLVGRAGDGRASVSPPEESANA
jgi:hypothetical protein